MHQTVPFDSERCVLLCLHCGVYFGKMKFVSCYVRVSFHTGTKEFVSGSLGACKSSGYTFGRWANGQLTSRNDKKNVAQMADGATLLSRVHQSD